MTAVDSAAFISVLLKMFTVAMSHEREREKWQVVRLLIFINLV